MVYIYDTLFTKLNIIRSDGVRHFIPVCTVMKEDTPISGLGTSPQVFNTVIRLTVFIVALAVLTFCLHFGSKCTTLWSDRLSGGPN